ncbi:PREDICTED: uncharacterized protein LOC109175972 isoform X2 [Ipomoea nil]|uniref:uncharacterized protein LOC109175972 isoform X2 n=1 Tax=Ipomoea nil TaxID=35883 RepID=UPI000900D26F|nr:PREDICTED: uncharacterized protein LOC109175972 isoform X2 [Ipomoea nil]
MALPLGKVAFLFGTGVVVSALSKESSIGDYFSGAFKILWKQIKQDNSKSSNPKPHSDALLKQVNSLREELQLLASNRSVTIITSGGSGSSGKYGMIVVVVVVGYGYLWWKGWKLPDMMFATRRGLTDACSTVSKQLESVYTSIAATKRHLSSRIDRVDSKIDECGDNTVAVKEEVSEVRGEVRAIGDDLQSVHLVVQNLETKISRIGGKQNETNFGLGKLVAVARNLENRRAMEQIEASASSSVRPALELPEWTPSTVVEPLSPNSPVEPPSPSASNGFQKRSPHGAVPSSPSGAKIHRGISDVVGMASGNSPLILNAGVTFGRTLSASAAFITRSHAAVRTFK